MSRATIRFRVLRAGRDARVRFAALLVAAAVIGCGRGPGDPDRLLPGRLVVGTHDEADAPVGGVLVEARDPDDPTIVWARARTGLDGLAEVVTTSAAGGGALPGGYALHASTPGGYQIGPGQANPVRATVRTRETTRVTMRLARLR